MITGGRIIGFEAKRIKDVQGTGMSVNINIDDLRVDGGKLVAAYTYSIDYQPELAKMSIRGELFMDEKGASDIVAKWKKSKEFPPVLAEDLLTAIQYAASAVGTLLAFGLGINAPLAVSRAHVAQQPKGTKAA
jgi:hypothetical protein